MAGDAPVSKGDDVTTRDLSAHPLPPVDEGDAAFFPDEV